MIVRDARAGIGHDGKAGGEGGMSLIEPLDTVRPDQAGVLPRTFPAKRANKNRRGKKQPCYSRSTTKTGQSWKSIIDETGKFAPAKCPKCGTVIVFDLRGFPSCGQCDHALSHEDREAIAARDPEAIMVRNYMKKLDAKIKRMSGKERREKRFLSKCAGGGC